MMRFRAARVLTTDPYVPLSNDPELLPLDEVIAGSDVLVLCAPYETYRWLDTKDKHVVDVWGFLRRKSAPQHLP